MPVNPLLKYETIDDGRIAVISLGGGQPWAAQDRRLLVELDSVMSMAQFDDAVRVVILRGAARASSSEDEPDPTDAAEDRDPGNGLDRGLQSPGHSRGGIEGKWLQEWHFFVQNTRRWRDLRKVTIASVQGPVRATGLMVMWACDLIVADTTTEIADVSGTGLGMCGVEYFAHPWEFGARRAKDLLLTGASLSVQDAYRLGMVSRIFQPADLELQTVKYARRISALPSATSLMIKESVNQAQDHAGFHVSLQTAFNLHELNHAHYGMQESGPSLVYSPALGAPPWTEQLAVAPASGDTVHATPVPEATT